MANDREIKEAKAFWLSDAAGDTINYPWEAAADYANAKCDMILSALSARRDYHLACAQEQITLVTKYASRHDPESVKSLSDASGAANWHNFAANSLMFLLREIDTGSLKPGAGAARAALLAAEQSAPEGQCTFPNCNCSMGSAERCQLPVAPPAPYPPTGAPRGCALLQHFKAMQEMCSEWLTPATYKARHSDGVGKFYTEFNMPKEHQTATSAAEITKRRDDAFINDIIYMLDGPEQRFAQSACTAPPTGAPREPSDIGFPITGWKLVPVEPTEAMALAGQLAPCGIGGSPPSWQVIYQDMLSAAPPAPAGDGWREVLKDCADDLEAMIQNLYFRDGRIHTAYQRKYQRDMEPVLRARALLPAPPIDGEKE